MSGTREVESVLRGLDAAPDQGFSSPDARTRAVLERVVAVGTAEDRASAAAARRAPAPRTTRPRRRTRALLLTGVLVAATTTGLVVVPPLLGGGDEAYASWTAVPDGLSAQERHDAAGSCRDEQHDAGGPVDHAARLDDATVAIAERRGAWVTVVLAGADGFSATCTTDASAPFGDGWVGSVGVLPEEDAPGPRDLVPVVLGRGTTDTGDFSTASGAAGADVTGVTYDSAVHGTVVATVSGGQFALWMPGDELDDAQADGVPVDVTYVDGSTATVMLRL